MGSVGSAELGPPRRPSQVEVPRWKVNFSGEKPNPGEKQQNTVRLSDILTTVCDRLTRCLYFI